MEIIQIAMDLATIGTQIQTSWGQLWHFVLTAIGIF
jgi:hypothetical protein